MTRRGIGADRLYQEKREAYLGLLGAIHLAAVRPSDENSKNYGLWQTRCELFGSREVSAHAQEFANAAIAQRAEKETAFRLLIDSMRADLRR